MFVWQYISNYIRIINQHDAPIFYFISLQRLYMFRAHL
jgi:hypothetical protein